MPTRKHGYTLFYGQTYFQHSPFITLESFFCAAPFQSNKMWKSCWMMQYAIAATHDKMQWIFYFLKWAIYLTKKVNERKCYKLSISFYFYYEESLKIEKSKKRNHNRAWLLCLLFCHAVEADCATRGFNWTNIYYATVKTPSFFVVDNKCDSVPLLSDSFHSQFLNRTNSKHSHNWSRKFYIKNR